MKRIFLTICFVLLTSCSYIFTDYERDEIFVDKVLKDILLTNENIPEFNGEKSSVRAFRISLNNHLRSISNDRHLGLGDPIYKKQGSIKVSQLQPNITSIKIPTMRISDRKMREIELTILKNDHIIFDLRGNKGGSVGSVVDLLNAVEYPREKFGIDYNQYVIPSFKTPVLKQKQRLVYKNNEYQQEIDIDKLCEGLECSYYVDEDELHSSEYATAPASSKKLYIIYDEKCYSACELFLIYSEYFKNRTTFSKSSSGGGYSYGGVIKVRLPESGVWFYVPRTRMYFNSNELSKGEGIKPDVQIPYFHNFGNMDIIRSFIKRNSRV